MNDIGNSIAHLQIAQTVVIGAHQCAGTAGFGCAEELAAGGATKRIFKPIYIGIVNRDFASTICNFPLRQCHWGHPNRRGARQTHNLAGVAGPIDELFISCQTEVADRASHRTSGSIVIERADGATANRLGADFARRAKFSARWQTVLIA